ncbi:VOC family protein [Sphingobium aromaticiconvertens]|uniref:VOC family protein n=1 Tax=Sphingobium aromaticiconvertens TaxID=365341 RepID=UPI003016E6B8
MADKPMSRINQIAYMVPDLHAAIDWWTQVMGVGPFFIFPTFDVTKGDYRGQAHIAEFGAAIAYSGDLMVELIEPRGPSIFQEFLADGKTGIHHLCVFTDDLAETEQWIAQRGGTRLQGATFADGSTLAYFAMDAAKTVILEVAQLKPEVQGLFAAIEQAGANWDGVTKIFSLP